MEQGSSAGPESSGDEMKTRQEVLIYARRRGQDRSVLRAAIEVSGDLVLSGHDTGPTVSEYWPSGEYEYKRTVRAEHLPAIERLLREEAAAAKTGWRRFWFWRTRAKTPRPTTDQGVLDLIKDRFVSEGDFSTWLEGHGIPSELFNWSP